MNDTLAGASPVDQPVGRPLPKRYEGGRIKGGCSLHDAEAALATQAAEIERLRTDRHDRCAARGHGHDGCDDVHVLLGGRAIRRR